METTRLCSEFDPEHRVTCDLPEKHGGAHKATVLFGDEETPADDA